MMEVKNKKALYHCGNCGALFESPKGWDDERQCGNCARPPGTGIWPDLEVITRDEDARVGKYGEAELEDSGIKAIRKKRPKNTLMRIIIVWTFLMLLAMWTRHRYTVSEREQEKREAAETMKVKGGLADEKVAMLNRALPDSHRSLAGFLTAGTPEARNQYVADPIDTAGKMAVFYANNPFPKVNPAKLVRTGQEPIKVGADWMVETRWKEEGGLEFDAIFQRQGSGWKLDWKQFARYSDYPWALFLAGDGPAEAEFRLLARKLLSGDVAERGGSRIGFVLFSPLFGKSGETGMESPEFIVDRRSDEGLLLDAAFNAKEEGRQLFGRSMEAMEPDGLIRVRVLVTRTEVGGLRKFSIEKILGCHWIETGEVGYNLEGLRDDLFGKE